MDDVKVDAPIWTPDQGRVENSALYAFMRECEVRSGRKFDDYASLHAWSIEDIGGFWDAVWDFCGVVGEKGAALLVNPDTMTPGADRARFFPEVRVNYAENMLRKRDESCAIVFKGECGDDRSLSYRELYEQVSRWQQALRAAGVGKGDRVAGYMPNMPETIIAMLAVASLGAIWASASPDFGVQGVIDRFGQIEPTVLIAVDGYYYNGKEIDCLAKVKDVQPALKGLKKTVIVPFLGGGAALPDGAVYADEFLDAYSSGTPQDVEFERVAFDHPLFVMFSSGTTGAPKCIVHGHGGVLLQHLKELQLHSDIKAGDKVFFFTTCGWMMWNWLVSGLAGGATLMLYDGSPFYPDGNVLWDYADEYDFTFFGTSAKYIDALKVHGLKPRETHDLGSLRTIATTGSPLVHESFDYIYRDIKKDVHVASISGGTDIVSCFMLGNSISPVYRGELQGAGLGLAVDVFDDVGEPTRTGELVCTRPFPCMPVGFWNDDGDARYRAAYFEVFDNIWAHGDWVERTCHGGFIIHGRSDATLNPGGVRIGTAEIYRQVEQVEGVVESVCVGQDWDGDVRVILFVVLKDGVRLDDALIAEIKAKIRVGASPRHVPAKILAVGDIPRTKSGKITELAVRDVIVGRVIKNVEALANPQALALFEGLEALQS
ncbi:MAG: acetoacetate--CoA ligase [Alphaproteobacteria bacterium]